MLVELSIVFRVKVVAKACAILLQPEGEHTPLGWPFGELCILFNVKP
jgi:hypothetical protein